MNSLAEANKVKIVCSDSIQSMTMTTADSTTTLTTTTVGMVDCMHELPVSMGKGAKPSDSHHGASSGLEPMDTVTPPSPSPSDKMITSATDLHQKSEDVQMVDRTQSGNDMAPPEELDADFCDQPTPSVSSQMQVESQDDPESEPEKTPEEESLTVDDLHLLCDLFYLPFEHGSQGLQILNEFHWLKTNSHIVAGITSRDRDKPEVAEWYHRAMKFEELTRTLNRLLTRLNMVSNRELLYELYPYMWDMRGVVSLLNSYVKWLALGQIPSTVTSYIHGNYTWFSKGWRESFASGEQEPWVIRGGLTAELQRLIPVDRGTDLYVYKAPEVPSSRTYTIRNYRPPDENAVYKVCTTTFKDGMCAAEDFINFPKLPGDMKLGGFLSLNSDLSFVVEDENEVVVGIALGAINGREFRRNLNKTWVPSLREKYSLSSTSSEMDYVRETVRLLHSDLSEVPDEIVASHPAELRVALMVSLMDQSVSKRLLTCILAALRANGIFGCFVEVSPNDKYFIEFYKKLGFTELHPQFLGRSF
jgi:protein O-GlcNAcase/histone acetyltransferase